jgi:ABC-type polysaccharide/polyol phosphate transport system ATPase subunit
VTSAITVEALCKSFVVPHERRDTLKERFLHPFRKVGADRSEALRGVSFEVRSGEFFGVIGPNGSGKSTLLKIIAGIYVGDSGTVRVEGALSPFIELGVGFNDELSGRENIRINAALLGLPLRDIEHRFDAIVAFAGLERFIDQKLKNYSSGMRVRLAYAIAIQVEFDILLLDEVLAVGDQEFQERCFETLSEIQGRGKTIVFVSHDLEAIRRHCDRVLLLERGNVAALGDPSEALGVYDTHVHEPAGAAD